MRSRFQNRVYNTFLVPEQIYVLGFSSPEQVWPRLIRLPPPPSPGNATQLPCLSTKSSYFWSWLFKVTLITFFMSCTHILRLHKFYFSFVLLEKDGRTPEILWLTFIRYFLKSSVFSLFLEGLLNEYSLLTLNRCNIWTTKFDVITFLSLNTKNCNIQNYDIFLNTFADNLI